MLVSDSNLTLASQLTRWWRQRREDYSTAKCLCRLLAISYEFLRDSLPQRRRQRYGDMDYDWEQHVDTTSATVTWRTRLLGLLNSPYQPIPPEQFREIMAVLNGHFAPESDFSKFTFIDIGAGKGRALLLAAEFGFRRIVGVELLPELVQVARQNVQKFERREASSGIQLICGDATDFIFPEEPSVIFLFNPLPQAALRTLIENLERSLRQNPRPIYVAYANPTLQEIIGSAKSLRRLGGNSQCCLLFRSSAG